MECCYVILHAFLVPHAGDLSYYVEDGSSPTTRSLNSCRNIDTFGLHHHGLTISYHVY